jgi:hypothetical protein
MAARVTWILLLPALFLAGGVSYLTVLLTCGDDGPADYGDRDASEFCQWASDRGLELLAYSGFIPFLLALFGAALWRDPRALRWFNGFVFVVAGVLVTVLAWVATAEETALLFVALWVLAAVVARSLTRDGEPSGSAER